MNPRALNQLFDMTKRLRQYARRLKLSYDCNVILLEYDEAESRLEDDGKTYHYPASIGMVIENWSTWKGSFRVHDGRIIPEGADLNGPGISLGRLYRRMLKQLKAHSEVIALHERADKENAVVFNGRLIKAKGFKAKQWFGYDQAVFTIFVRGGKSDWYGKDAADALSNAAPFLKRRPIRIELKKES